jgi:ribosomal-protein-serine acetyltransferase
MSFLRPLDLSDTPAVFAAADCSRDALRRWMVWYRDAYALADAETWVRHAVASHAAGADFHFAVCDDTGQLAGVLGLESVSEETGRAMLGYWLATPATGRGLGTRAVAEALAWARGQSRLQVIWALVAETNERSRRVLEANGFRVVGIRDRDERGDVPLVYEIELRAAQSPSADV